MEYEIRDGVCYATVNSFVSMMDAEAMVEEEDGVVRVNASAVVEVVEIPAQGESMSEEFQKTVEAAQMQAAEDGLWMTPDETQQPVDGMGEEDPVPAVTDAPVAANVVMDDLNMVAVEGEQYLVANDRYLYAGDGLIEINGCVAAPIRVLAKVFNLDGSRAPSPIWTRAGRPTITIRCIGWPASSMRRAETNPWRVRSPWAMW